MKTLIFKEYEKTKFKNFDLFKQELFKEFWLEKKGKVQTSEYIVEIEDFLDILFRELVYIKGNDSKTIKHYENVYNYKVKYDN